MVQMQKQAKGKIRKKLMTLTSVSPQNINSGSQAEFKMQKLAYGWITQLKELKPITKKGRKTSKIQLRP